MKIIFLKNRFPHYFCVDRTNFRQILSFITKCLLKPVQQHRSKCCSRKLWSFYLKHRCSLSLKNKFLKYGIILRYFNFEPSFKLRWCRARDLPGSQIPVTTGGFELRIYCKRSSYLTHYLTTSNL